MRVITRADDAAMAISANEAIIDSINKGVACNVSIMVTDKYLEDFIRRLDSVSKKISVGLHLTLNCEWNNIKRYPISDNTPSLLNADGSFFFTTGMALHENGAKTEDILTEAKAQLDKLRGLNVEVDYLDEHCGISWVAEGTKEALIDFCKKESIIYGASAGGDESGIGKLNGSSPESFIQSIKENKEETAIVIAHPMYNTDEANEFTHDGATEKTGENRDKQRLVFMDESVLRYFEENNITPVRYKDVF